MKQLVFLFLLISFKSFSQSIEIGNVDNIRKTIFNEGSEELYVFRTDRLSVYDINTLKEISQKSIDYPFDDFISKYSPISVNSEIYFTELHGGQVFKLKDFNFVKIDNSFTHRMQISSTLFSYDKTIYKYGGYGFWSMRDFFTYFDTKTHEWEIIPPSGSKVKPNGTQSSVIDILDDCFYVYGGLALNPFEPTDFYPNKEVWSFKLSEKSWDLLGKTRVDFSEFSFDFPFDEKHIFYNREGDDLLLVDVENNQVKRYKKQNFQYLLNTSFKSFYKDGIFYCITRTYSSGEIDLVKIKEDDFFGELKSKGKLYYNNERVFLIVGILFSIFILLVILSRLKRYLQKRNRIVIHNNKIRYKGNLLDFDEKSVKIILLLLNSDENVPSNDILGIVENKELNHGHNTRVKNNLVDEINFKLKSVLGIEKNLITFHKSEIDKRIKVYNIDKSYFYFK